MHLIAKATIQIQKPVEEVFEGIVDPEKMTKYFISESNGRLEPGKDLVWKFPEISEQFPIKHIEVENNRSISFVWDPDTEVKITLEPQADGSTLVKVVEDGKILNVENLKWVIGNTEGWANFLACLKAYLEYGIQLRKGAYEYMRKPV